MSGSETKPCPMCSRPMKKVHVCVTASWPQLEDDWDAFTCECGFNTGRFGEDREHKAELPKSLKCEKCGSKMRYVKCGQHESDPQNPRDAYTYWLAEWRCVKCGASKSLKLEEDYQDGVVVLKVSKWQW